MAQHQDDHIHDLELSSSSDPHRHPVQHARHARVVDPEEERAAWLFIVFLVGLQLALLLANRRFPHKMKLVTLTLLWMYPLLVLYKAEHWDWFPVAFVLLWAAWSLQTGRLLRLARQKELQSRTPERVYSWFMRSHNVCYRVGMTALYVLLFLPGPCVLLLFVALYFGVLTRDVADLAAEFISNSVGFSKYEEQPPNLCGLCGEELVPMLEVMSGEASREEAERKVLQLNCKHRFHDVCIRGWSLVGKKSTCPFCKEKVDLKALVPDLPWNSKRVSLLWIRLLIILRFLVVWNPIIVNADLLLLRLMHVELIHGPREGQNTLLHEPPAAAAI